MGLVTSGPVRVTSPSRDSGGADFFMPYSSFHATDPKYRGILRGADWSLCVGAGLSTGLVPQWEDLTRAVFSRATGMTINQEQFKQMAGTVGWGLDAWLQAGLNEFIVRGGSRAAFTTYIAEELYSELLAKAQAEGMRDLLARALGNPKSNSPKDSLRLFEFLDRECHGSSLLAVARWLRRASSLKLGPRGVLTFNADGLLDVVLTLLALKDHGKGGFPKDEFRRVVRTANRIGEAIPVYHLHGCLAPTVPEAKKLQEARENLIFPESGYSRISSTVATWQQTVFLSHAQSHRLVFFGLSMSDPNLRRWLSWCTANAVQEAKAAYQKTNDELIMGDHIWIRPRPKNALHAQALEHSLIHLGTRIAWLESWEDVAPALDNLLSLPS